MGNSKSSIETCMNPYLLLEVPHAATIEDIKKAYRKMAKKWHPDKNGGSKDAEEKFKQINAAYECLIDPGKRAALDANRLDQEKAEAAKKAKAETDRQARARAYAQQLQPGRVSISPLAVVFAFIAFVFIIVTLFGSNDGGAGSTSA